MLTIICKRCGQDVFNIDLETRLCLVCADKARPLKERIEEAWENSHEENGYWTNATRRDALEIAYDMVDKCSSLEDEDPGDIVKILRETLPE